MLLRVTLLLATLAACSGREPTPATRFDAGPPPRRVIGAPPRQVRALPPHAIGVEGVGPYKLGVPMSQILSTLPSGPRMALLQIAGVLDYTVVRDEGLLVGGERQGAASFIAVVRQEIARTEDGVGVGATVSALEAGVGPALMSPGIARDPSLWVGARLPGARFVVNGGKVTGVLLTSPAELPSATAAPPVQIVDPAAGVAAPPRCDRTAAAAIDFAGVAAGVRFVPACLGGADGVGNAGETVVVASRPAQDTRARRVAATEIRGLRWAAPIELDRGRDEIVAVAESRDDDVRVFTVIALRLEGTRLVRVAESEVYRLDEQRAAWIGASLGELSLHLEIKTDGDELVVGGVLAHGGPTGVRELAPLLPVTVRRRGRPSEGERPRVETEPVAADAGAGPIDAFQAGRTDATATVPGP